MSQKDRPTFTPDDTQSAREAADAQLAAEGVEPGVQRVEAAVKRAEELIRQSQEILDEIGVQGADASALQIEREVRQALNEFNEVYVSHAQSEFAYAWIYRDPGNQFGGRYVRKMQALGWEVVQGDNPEAQEHRFVDGTRVVSDCVLMRIRIDRKMMLDKRDRLLREAQQEGIVSRVHELAERAGTRVYDKLPGFVEEALSSQADQRRASAQRAFHRMNASGKVDRMLKTGTIPGVPAPGAGGRS